MMYMGMMLALIFCSYLCIYRIFRGPTAPDRAVAVDILGIVVVGFCAIIVLFSGKGFLMDIAIAWTLQAYIAVLALAKYLEGKRFDE